MNRLLELQKVSADEPTFSPTAAGGADGAVASAPSAAAATDDGFTNLATAGDAPSAISSGETNEYTVQTDPALDAALALIQEIHTGNREIQRLTAKLKQQTADNIKSFNAEADEGAEAIQDIMQEVQVQSKTVKDKLAELDQANKDLCANEERMKDNAATVQIQKNQHAHLARCFMQYIGEYHAAVTENERMLREQAVRRIKTKYTKADGSTVTDEEAKELAQQVLEFGRSDVLFSQSKEVLESVLQNREDIMRIERGMRELSQMTSDLAALVLEQGEILDVIAENVKTSVSYVQSANKHLTNAREMAEETSSNIKYVGICAACIFIIILAVVLGATIPTG